MFKIVSRWKQSLKKYEECSNERLLNTVEGEGILGGGNMKKEILEARHKNFLEKSLRSQFMRITDDVRSQEIWNCLKQEP